MGLKLVLGLALDSIVRWKRIQYFSLLWEKPQVPLEFPCVIEAIVEFEAYPISLQPTFHPRGTSGGTSFYLSGQKKRRKKHHF